MYPSPSGAGTLETVIIPSPIYADQVNGLIAGRADKMSLSVMRPSRVVGNLDPWFFVRAGDVRRSTYSRPTSRAATGYPRLRDARKVERVYVDRNMSDNRPTLASSKPGEINRRRVCARRVPSPCRLRHVPTRSDGCHRRIRTGRTRELRPAPRARSPDGIHVWQIPDTCRY